MTDASPRNSECDRLEHSQVPLEQTTLPNSVFTTYSHHATQLLRKGLEAIKQPATSDLSHHTSSHQLNAMSDQLIVNEFQQKEVSDESSAKQDILHLDGLARSFAATLMDQGLEQQAQHVQSGLNIQQHAQDQEANVLKRGMAELVQRGKLIASATAGVGEQAQLAAVSDLKLQQSRSRYGEAAELMLSSATQAEQQHVKHQALLQQVGKISLNAGFNRQRQALPKPPKERLALKLGTAIRDANLQQQSEILQQQGFVNQSTALGSAPRFHQQHQARDGSERSFTKLLSKIAMESAFQQQVALVPPGSYQAQQRVIVHVPGAYWIVWLVYLAGVVAFAGVLGWLLISIFRWPTYSMGAGVGLVVMFGLALEFWIYSYESNQFRHAILPFRTLLLCLVIFSTALLSKTSTSLTQQSLAYSSQLCLSNPAYLLLTFRTLATQACIWATSLATLALAAVTFLPAAGTAGTAGCHVFIPRGIVFASIALVCATVQLCGLVHARYVAKVSGAVQANVEHGDAVCATAFKREGAAMCHSSVSLLVWISALLALVQVVSVLLFRINAGLFVCTLAGAFLVFKFTAFGISSPAKPQNLRQAIALFNATFVGAKGKVTLLVSYCLSLIAHTSFACLLYIPCGIVTLLASQQLMDTVAVDTVPGEAAWEGLGRTWQAWAVGASVASLWAVGLFVYATMVVSLKWATYAHMLVQQRQFNAEEAATKLLEKGLDLSNDKQ